MERQRNAEMLSEALRSLKVLKNNMDVIRHDISSIKQDIFTLKTLGEVKSDTKPIEIKKEKVEEPPKPESWWWGY
tara:strand:- start:527 stop:751 length:225 start_codon:yes stop_codon:yes gene_type:complete